MKSIRDSVVIVCSIVRNAAKGIERNMPIMERLLSLCRDYRVFVYENDSTDRTKDLLKEWRDKHPDKIYISLNQTDVKETTVPSVANDKDVNPFFSRKRIYKMSKLRNYYMEYIEHQGWTGDYLIIVDLDVAQLQLNGILSSFQTEQEWDAVTSFGYSLSPKLKRRYHDTYALTEYGDEQNPQTERKIKDLAEKYGNMKTTDAWVRVFSAFGGLAIYRFEAIKGLRYKLIENRDDRVEVRCEHFSIYKQMADKGYDKVYINPSMVLKYQDLTWEIVYNALKRFIRIS